MNVYVARSLARELGRRGIYVDIFTRLQDPHIPRISRRLGETVRRDPPTRRSPGTVQQDSHLRPPARNLLAGVPRIRRGAEHRLRDPP